jgi:hypothetical protein
MNVEAEVHHRVHRLYESRDPLVTNSETLRVREWVETQPLETQHRIGLQLLQRAYSDFTQ